MTEPVAAKAGAVADIVGFIDAVAHGKVFGWVFARSHPDARIEIEVRAGNETLGTTVADRPREDLKAGGIGDGGHAFEFTLPDGLAVAPNAVTVFAKCPATGKLVPLRPPAAADAAESGDLVEAIRRIELRVERVQESQRTLLRVVTSMAAIRENAATSAVEVDTSRVAREPQEQERSQALAGQLEGIEVHLMRLDTTLHSLDRATRALRRNRPPTWLPAAVTVLTALAAASLILQFVAILD